VSCLKPRLDRLRRTRIRIAQVLRNLSRNAVEHTHSDGLARLTATA